MVGVIAARVAAGGLFHVVPNHPSRDRARRRAERGIRASGTSDQPAQNSRRVGRHTSDRAGRIDVSRADGHAPRSVERRDGPICIPQEPV